MLQVSILSSVCTSWGPLGQTKVITTTPPPKTSRRSIEYSRVFSGTQEKTKWGKGKSDLVFSKHLKRVVSKAKSESAKVTVSQAGNEFDMWRQAREVVRQELNLGKTLCGGRTSQGQAFLKATRARYQQLKDAA